MLDRVPRGHDFGRLRALNQPDRGAEGDGKEETESAPEVPSLVLF